MRIDDFQNLALRLANQQFVRIYYYLNYPQDPQWLGLQLLDEPTPMLRRELLAQGFRWHEGLHIWVIDRTA